jgi:Zn-dependent protease/predicted transcriptional regulator
MPRGNGFKIGRVFGIPIYLHSSWFLVFVLITLSLAAGFAAENQDWTSAQQWAVGIVASILFFSSVVFHELSHSVVARHYKIPVASITLFVFGGVASITREPDRAWHEFLIAVAGPISSCVLGIGFLSLQHVSPEGSVPYVIGDWLGWVNLSLALFNLIPGFPLDGGRILRSIMWGVTQSYIKATRIAARSGQAFGFLMMGVGIAAALFGRRSGLGMSSFQGLWIAFIGWFLLNMARQSFAQATTQDALSGLTVADLMLPDAPTVGRDLSLEEYSRELTRTKSRTHLVVSEGHLAGLITMDALRSVPQSEWAGTSVQAVMLPRERVQWVAPEQPALSLMERMRHDRLQEVAVVSDDRVVGLVTLESVAQAVQIRADLHRAASKV